MRALLALLFISSLLLTSQHTSAQEAIQVLDTSVTTDFPLFMTFHIEAQAQEPIARVEVRFRIERRSCVQVESSGFPEFTPNQRVTG